MFPILDPLWHPHAHLLVNQMAWAEADYAPVWESLFSSFKQRSHRRPFGFVQVLSVRGRSGICTL